MDTNAFNTGYGIYTTNTLWLCKDFRELQRAMQMPEAFCEIFSAPTFEEAEIIMRQWYPHHFWVLPFNRGVAPLQMKQSGEFALTRESIGMISSQTSVSTALSTTEAPVTSSVAGSMPDTSQGVVSMPMVYAPNNGQCMSNYIGFWSVTCAQGMGVSSNIEKVINMLSSPKCLYSHAVKGPTPQAASYWAWKEYVTRFFQRNDASTVRINLPSAYLRDGEFFFDKYYESREAERKENPKLAKLKSFGIC